MVTLGRIITLTSEGYALEADPQHAELLGKDETKGATTAGTGEAWQRVDLRGHPIHAEAEEMLDASETTQFRSFVKLAAYLSVDRPDIAYAVKECAREMNAPSQASKSRAKRIGCYLRSFPRAAAIYKWQPLQTTLYAECDSGYGGCLRSRKSTTGFTAFLGTHPLRATATTQSIIATSTPEAEFYAIVSAVSVSIGLKAMLADFGIPVDLKLGCGTTAGTRCGSYLRRGRHIDIGYLWVQRALANGLVTVKKVGTEINTSDLMTRNVPEARVSKLMGLLGFKYLDGLSPPALQRG